jgi:hypothetical protein
MTADEHAYPVNRGCESTGVQAKQPEVFEIIISPRVNRNGKRHPTDFDCWLERGPLANASLMQYNATLRAQVADMMRIQNHRRAKATAKPAHKVKAHR